MLTVCRGVEGSRGPWVEGSCSAPRTQDTENVASFPSYIKKAEKNEVPKLLCWLLCFPAQHRSLQSPEAQLDPLLGAPLLLGGLQKEPGVTSRALVELPGF